MFLFDAAYPRTLLFPALYRYIMAMTEKNDPFEHSDYAGEFVEDDIVLRLDIYRPAGTNGDWTLEVVDETGATTVWDEPFATDRDAYEEFLATIERDGIRAFLEEPVTLLH